MKWALIACFLIPTSAFCQYYYAIDAKKHVGDSITLSDEVTSVTIVKGGGVFLNLGAEYPNQHLQLRIRPEDIQKFPYKLTDLVGRSLFVYGKVVKTKKKIEIAVSNPKQLTLINFALD